MKHSAKHSSNTVKSSVVLAIVLLGFWSQTSFAKEDLFDGIDLDNIGEVSQSNVKPVKNIPPENCSTENLIGEINRDLLRFSLAEQEDIRYISLFHLTCQSLDSRDLDAYRSAVIKLLNSLSWNSKLIKVSTIDSRNSIFRINLKQFYQIVNEKGVRSWKSAKIWDLLVDSEPYHLLVQNKLVGKDGNSIMKDSFPFIRGDWFIYFASRTPLYDKILGIEGTQKRIEEILEVDTEKDILSAKVARAGFERSGVSAHNRIIERHEARFGAYWLSYDFKSSSGHKNIYTYPTGPKRASSETDALDLNDKAFLFDGGEFIFNLPNGLQAYFLTDSAGKRLDRGPIEVVSDPAQQDRRVHNANSCMGCHSGGIIEARDFVKETVFSTPGNFTARQLNFVKSVYADDKKINDLMKEDQKRFENALSQIGLTTQDTVRSSSSNFEGNINQLQLASELGISIAKMKLIATHPNFRKVFAPLANANAKIKRESFDSIFVDFNKDLLKNLIEFVDTL